MSYTPSTKELTIGEVVLLLLATAALLTAIGLLVLHLEQHRVAEQESHMMGCKYLGKLHGPSNLYAFECGQLIQLKRL